MKESKILAITLVFILLSCKKDTPSIPNPLTEFRYYNLENAGWKSKTNVQKVSNIIYKATEVPIQYYLLKDLGNSDLEKVDSIYEKHKRERIIEFVFEHKNQKDLLLEEFTKKNYQNSVEYMSFSIQNDFNVVTSKNDTIPCSGVLFERYFKVAPQNKVLLFFSGISPNDDVQLVYRDKLFDNGILKFKFNKSIIPL